MFALLLFNISYSPLLQSLVQDFVFIFMYMEIRVAHLLQDIRYCIQTKDGIHTEVSASFAVQHEKTVVLRLLFEPWSLPFVSKSPETSASKNRIMLWEVTVQCKLYWSWGIIFVALSPSWKCLIKPEGKRDLFYQFLEHFNSILAVLLSVRSFFFFNSIKFHHYTI